MEKSLTIRMPRNQREALRKRARQLQLTESHLVRSLIDRDLESQTLLARLGDLVGAVESPSQAASGSREEPGQQESSMKERLRRANWRD